MADKDINRMWIGIRIFFAIILALIIYFGFFVKQPLGIDVEFLYQAWHPFGFIEGLACVAWLIILLFLSGLIKAPQPKSEKSTGPTVWIVAVCALVIVLSFII